MEEIKDIGEFEAPYGKQLTFKNVAYDNGFNMLRVRIKEGKRFTDMDLDADTIIKWQALFAQWLAEQKPMDAK